ncbi:MAG: AmmeMemoRadiSam system protein A [Candidatus Atribacteria bacterium]|nr:AmmeMemoRadiSam system protein A [Candidatus Atribacteria bacterium]
MGVKESRTDFGKDITTIARKSIVYYLQHGEVMSLPFPGEVHPDLLTRRNGAFVSLKKNGDLRGCIGTFLPQYDNLLQEVIRNAVSAATEDPRFSPVNLNELSSITLSVDVLTEPEKAESPRELDPKVYGVIVQSGWRKGLLLPDLEGVDTVEEQLHIARRKAGIRPSEPVEILRFRVERYREEPSGREL